MDTGIEANMPPVADGGYALPKWIAELHEEYEDEAEADGSAGSAFDGTLGIYLRQPDNLARAKRVMDGRFLNKSGEYLFVSSDRPGAIYPVAALNQKLSPLLAHLTSNRILVRLTTRKVTGKQEREVTDLVPKPEQAGFHRSGGVFSETGSEQPLFRSMVNRLLNGKENPCSPANAKKWFTTVRDLRALLDICRSTYPPAIAQWAEENLTRLEESSYLISKDETNHIHRSVMYVLNIDWQVAPPQTKPVGEVREELDARFYGLDSVKVRIMEIIAQLQHTKEYPKWGILLCGPAGTGKTSIAEAIASALSLPMIRLDMSTICDGEMITGSSRIYTNAKPGCVMDALFACGKANSAVLINELDKTNEQQRRTSPADALLTLIDGLGFVDNYFDGLVIPTNGMFFIATCNDPDRISKPLLDRFLRIDIPAYTQKEKNIIFEQYLFPQLLDGNRLTADTVSLTPEAVELLCSSYAVEPGVRDLQQYAEKLVSHYFLERAKGRAPSVCYSAGDIQSLLGPPKVLRRNYSPGPGMVFSAFVHNGVAQMFPVEAVAFPGTGVFTAINIPRGSVRDYCTAAYLCLRREMREVDFTKLDVTLYVPQEIPDTKQNYIGIAVYAAIVSAVGKMHFVRQTAFIGGCDLYSNTFIDESDISPLLGALSEAGLTTVYAPRGSGQCIHGNNETGMEIVESGDIRNLIQMALLASVDSAAS